MSDPRQNIETEFRSLYNLEAEMALLGAMLMPQMMDAGVIDAVADVLTPASFYEPIHADIFDVVVREHAQGKAPSPVTLKGYFENDERLTSVGGAGYLTRLTADTFGLFAWKELAQQVRDLHQRRTMYAGLRTAMAACADLEASVGEIIEHADGAVSISGKETIYQPTGAEAFDELIADFGNERHGVNCGVIPSLDSLLGGVRPKELIILAARPGMGKTALAGSYGLGAAYNGHGVLFVTLEMSAVELAGRMAADLSFDGQSGVLYEAIRDRTLNNWQRSKVIDARNMIAEMPFQIADAGSLTIGSLNMLIRRHKRRMEAKGQKLELVIVDYLQLLSPDKRTNNRYEAVSEVSRALKAMAKDHGVTVLALAQLSREVEKRPDKRPELSDLKESGQIEQDADVVMFLLRDEYYLRKERFDEGTPEWEQNQQALEVAKGKIEFICAKNRRGVTGTAMGEFHGGYQAVRG